MQGSLHRIGGQGNHTTKFNLQWQTSSFKSMPPLSLLEARAGTAAHPHRLQAPQGRKCPVLSSKASTAADSSCTSLPQSNTLCFPKHTVPPVCTTTPSTNSSVKSKAGQVPQLLMLPIASPEHTLLTPRENPDKKPKQNPQESKCSKLYFTWCKLKTTAPTYFSSSSSLSTYFWLRAVPRQSSTSVLLWI